MTIGIITNFFEFRNDIRKVATLLAKNNRIVFYLKPQEAKQINTAAYPAFEFRVIDEHVASVTNRLKELMFLVFKKIPSSRNNYYLMELFKSSNLERRTDRRKSRFYLFLQRIMPRLISYDRFLNTLHYSGKTNIQDIDVFLYATELHADFFIARLKREQKNVLVYVYSWDHACKQARFIKAFKYLVWSGGLSDDLAQLQYIPASNISVVGATQFGYIDLYNNLSVQLSRPFDFRSIYFGCAIGIGPLAKEEINLIARIAFLLKETNPDWKLVVRPYPQLRNHGYYDVLKEADNIILDNDFDAGIGAMTDEQILHKLNTVHHAECFMHIGTTLGLEAAFTNTPSYMLDLVKNNEKKLNLYHFVHQYQNDKYITNTSAGSVIKSEADLVVLFDRLKNGDVINHNQSITANFQVISFEAFTHQLSLLLSDEKK